MSTSQLRWWQKEEAIGLDVYHGRLVASHFTASESGPVLRRLVLGRYDTNADERQIAQAIRDLWKRERLPVRTVCTCLHSRALVVRYFKYENLDESELQQALELEAEEALQHSFDEIAMDWQLNSPSKQEFSGTLIAAPREIVQQHLKLIRSAGLYSISVEASCSALTNLYAFLNQTENNQPVCLINLAERTADIIMRSANGHYPRTLFSANKPWEQHKDYLLENIQNSLLYYHLKLKQPPIEKILLTGNLTKLGQFTKKLSEQTALPVKELDILHDTRLLNAPVDSDKIKDFNIATSIGLGLKGVNYDAV